MNAPWNRFGAALVLAALCLTACGEAAHSADPAPRAATEPVCVRPSGDEISVTADDDGKTLCVPVGAKIDVFLHGSTDAMWTPVTASGTALAPAPNGKGTLMIGVTGGFFAAIGTGTTVLSSTKPACTTAGAASCAAAAFATTIIVQ
jgi:hypothetical protein